MNEGPAGGSEPALSKDVSAAAVVLNWHDNVRTRSCLVSLLADEHIVLVVVVDNESDGSLRRDLSKLLGSRVRLIEAVENRGFSGGVNLGLAAVASEPLDGVLVINNDAVARDGAVELLLDRLSANPKAGVVSPTILNPDGSIQSVGGRIAKLSGLARQNFRLRRTDYLTWACVMIRPSVLEGIGLLDERYFMYWEDVDFSQRVLQAGMQLEIVPEAQVVHELSATSTRAGDRLREYYTWSLLTYGDIHGGVARFRTRIGLAWLLASRAIRLHPSGFVAIVRGARRPRTGEIAWKHLHGRA